MSKNELLNLAPYYVEGPLTEEEILYLYKVFDGYWGCDDDEIPKYHAKLKSGVCSDLFLYSEAILEYENIRKIIAKQLMCKYLSVGRVIYNLDWDSPTYIGGIPKGAKKLGDDTADIWSIEKADLVKQNGEIKMNSVLGSSDKLLLIEDVITKGTASKEAIKNVYGKKDSSGRILPFILSIVNRGGLKQIQTMQEGGLVFNIISLLSIKANEWEPSECPLCEVGSKPIKPKETEENWNLITAQQLT